MAQNRHIKLLHRLKRGAEHRKRVLEKKKELEVRKAQVKMDEIAADRSPGKVTSHNRLLGYIDTYGEAVFVKLYKKVELTKLSEAYGLEVRSRSTKADIGKVLVTAMRRADSMLNYHCLDNLTAQVEIDDTSQHIRIRFIRQ